MDNNETSTTIYSEEVLEYHNSLKEKRLSKQEKYEQQIWDLDLTITDLEAQLENVNDKHRLELNKQSYDLNKQIEILKLKLEDTESEYQVKIDDLNQQIEKLTLQIQQLINQQTKDKTLIEDLKPINSNQKDLIEELTKQLNQSKIDKQELEKEKTTLIKNSRLGYILASGNVSVNRITDFIPDWILNDKAKQAIKSSSDITTVSISTYQLFGNKHWTLYEITIVFLSISMFWLLTLLKKRFWPTTIDNLKVELDLKKDKIKELEKKD